MDLFIQLLLMTIYIAMYKTLYMAMYKSLYMAMYKTLYMAMYKQLATIETIQLVIKKAVIIKSILTKVRIIFVINQNTQYLSIMIVPLFNLLYSLINILSLKAQSNIIMSLLLVKVN